MNYRTKRLEILRKEAKKIWEGIPDKKSRKLEAVLERYAFFVNCRNKGLTTVEISKLSGFNHSTIVYATHCHEANMLMDSYREHYSIYLKDLTSIQELREMVTLQQELEETVKYSEKIRERIKNFELNKEFS